MHEVDSSAQTQRRQPSLGELASASGAGFGTSGVRARVVDLTADLCAAYTQAFLGVAEPRCKRILIGHDLRPSSPAIANACRSAARALGYEVIYCGVLPTPALAFAAQSLGNPAIMVTGSHIPFDRNGLKFYHAHGEITKADEQRILATPVPHVTPDADDVLPPPDSGALNLYLERYRRAFAPNALAGLRIGVYEHSSAARDVLHLVLRGCGADTISLGRSDEFVAIDTEAMRPEDREAARVWAGQHELDAIVSADGDADRPLVADEHGAWLHGDVLGMIGARELRAHSVVTPVTSNSGLESCGCFASIHRTRVGSPHVIAAMEQAIDAPVVGFEANGGFLLGSAAMLDHGPLAPLKTRDAVLPILLALSAVRRGAGRLSALHDKFAGRHTYSGRLQGVDIGLCGSLMERLAAGPQAAATLLMGSPAACATLDRTDGLRFIFETGDIIHLRMSGNAPELRCYADAENAARAEQLCLACLGRLKPQVCAVV